MLQINFKECCLEIENQETDVINLYGYVVMDMSKKKLHNKNAGKSFRSVRGILWKRETPKKGKICVFNCYCMPILI
jgi:hypothetical protein